MKKNRNWRDAELRSAIADIDKGVPIRTAGRDHRIPATTLRRHLYGNTIQRRRGKIGVLTEKKEEELVDYLMKM